MPEINDRIAKLFRQYAILIVQDGETNKFKEISCAEHYAHPDFDPEVAVDEIHWMVESLSHNRSLS